MHEEVHTSDSAPQLSDSAQPDGSVFLNVADGTLSRVLRQVVARASLVVVASPALPRPTKDVAAPGVVRGAGERQTWRVKTSTSRSTISIEPVLGLATLIMVRDAVRVGVGAARLPISLVAHDLADGTLVLWGDIDGPEIALWTLYPSRRLLSARVSAVLDFLKQEFPNGTPDELAADLGRYPRPLRT